jgi:hypothetical protein
VYDYCLCLTLDSGDLAAEFVRMAREYETTSVRGLQLLVYDYCLCLRLDSGDSAAAFVPSAQFASNYEKFITGKVRVYAAFSYLCTSSSGVKLLLYEALSY